ncbi:MAG: Maf family protein [Desulfobacterales bacterium]|jgi:septum formation protein
MQKSAAHPRLILASNSPRRRDLLTQAGLSFSVMPSEVDEQAVPISDPETYVMRLAESKAVDIAERHPASWVIGADTIVLIEDQLLGKPESTAAARDMLKQLSGNVHQVFTGYCICCMHEDRLLTKAVKTDVRFKDLSEAEIEWYIQTGEPFDKAGGYGIQGMGSVLVKSIEGSYTNVVGLPVCEVVDVLIKEGIVELNLENH